MYSIRITRKAKIESDLNNENSETDNSFASKSIKAKKKIKKKTKEQNKLLDERTKA